LGDRRERILIEDAGDPVGVTASTGSLAEAVEAAFTPPSFFGSTPEIATCLSTLDAINIAAVAQGLNLERLRLMREIGKDSLDARQSARSFWLPILQLVLLNLLLPTLTGLLG
jgi:hypothetical protein